MDTRLNSLDPAFRPIAVEWIARCVEAGIPVVIINTLRTPAEQATAIATGHSWTKHSRHLIGWAIDCCPYESYLLHGPDKLNWNAGDPVWQRMGALAKAIDPRVIWGGDWLKRDMGHIEVQPPTGVLAA
jgi:hypothetical protein